MDCGWGFAAMQVIDILDPPVNSFCILLCILDTLHNLRDEKRYSSYPKELVFTPIQCIYQGIYVINNYLCCIFLTMVCCNIFVA